MILQRPEAVKEWGAEMPLGWLRRGWAGVGLVLWKKFQNRGEQVGNLGSTPDF
jgi:hypothetical protein